MWERHHSYFLRAFGDLLKWKNWQKDSVILGGRTINTRLRIVAADDFSSLWPDLYDVLKLFSVKISIVKRCVEMPGPVPVRCAVLCEQ